LAGFTLLEVVVAIGLLGLVLVTSLELLGVGLRSVKASGDVTHAVILARQKLGELALRNPKPGIAEGRSGNYRWTVAITPEHQEEEGLPATLLAVRVKVSWRGTGGDKGVELVTLRAAGDEEKLPVSVPRGDQRGLPPPGPRRGTTR
jgi:type II secretory pathway pseudopilin PulG